jgi:hypothetical protein
MAASDRGTPDSIDGHCYGSARVALSDDVVATKMRLCLVVACVQVGATASEIQIVGQCEGDRVIFHYAHVPLLFETCSYIC